MQPRVVLPLGLFGRRLRRSWSALITTAAGSGDPAVHSDEPQEDDVEAVVAKAVAAERQQQERLVRQGGRKTPPPSDANTRKSPLATSPRIERTEVAPPVDPAFQQKRQLHGPEPALESVSCVGWDGTPLRGGGGGGGGDDRRLAEEPEEDYGEYFRHHKPSPLSEVEFADTRRPIRRATDSEVVDDEAGAGEVPPGWREEQEDTVDAALLRAEAMFREAAERGDPDTPHGRVLAGYQRAVLL